MAKKLDKINLEQVKKLAELGLTDAEISNVLGMCERTLNNCKKDKKFLQSLKEGKEISDGKVVKSLYKRALGYEYNEVTYEKSKTGGLGAKLKNDEIENVIHCDTNKVKIVVKQIVPDVTAQIFWLKNRRPDEWRDRIEHLTPPGIPFEIKVKVER